MTHPLSEIRIHASRSIITIVMAFILFLTAGIPTRAVFAAGTTLYVTTSGTDNGTCGPVLTPCATISQAVANAADGDTINIGSGIFFPPTDTPITIEKSLTLVGQGASNTMIYRSGTARRIFDITAGNVTIQNLTIWNGAATDDLGGGIKVSNGASLSLNSVTLKENQAANGAGVFMIGGGSLTVNNTVFTNNVATGNGGAIYMSGSGTLTITDSTFGGGSSTGNQAVNGAAIYQVDSTSAISGGSIAYNTASGSGGAVYLTGNSASLTVSNAALLTHNTANQYGGGFFLADGSLQTNTGTTISNNAAVENGGGIYQTAGSVTLTDTTVSSNSAILGGGLYQQAGLVSILRSTFNANTASTSGAGLYLASSSGAQSLTNSTISGNTANGTGTSDGGGAVYKAGSSTLQFDSVTVAYNLAARNTNSGVRVAIGSGVVTAQNTLFAANGTGTTNANCSGTLYSSSETNLDSGTSCGFSAERSNKDPQLLSLSNNGGYTFTHALPYLVGANPAIDNGSTSLLTDQRGKTRPSGSASDVGAFEFQQPTISLNTTGALAYGELTPADQIAPAATYTDDVNTYATGDQLTVTLTSAQTGDLLGILDTANITIDENGGVYYVIYNGVTTIGSVTGGKYKAEPDSSPLVISFNSSASRAAIEYLIRAVTFENTSVNPDTTTRSASFVIQHNQVSSATAFREIEVTNTNLPPVAKNLSVTINENETWTDSDFTNAAHYTDPDLHPMYGVVITQLPANGTLTVNGASPVLDETIAIGNVVYTPKYGYFGSDSFQWKAVDNGNEVVPGSDRKTSTAAATYSFTIVAQNDAPTTNGQDTKSLVAVDEDTANPAGATVTDLVTLDTPAYYDADGDTFAGIAVVANAAVSGQGTWQFSTNGGTSWVNIPVGIGSEVDNTKALVIETSAKLRFVPTENWNGTPGGLILRVWDGTAGQLSGPTGILRDISGLVGDTGAYSLGTLGLTTTVNPINDNPTAVELSATSVVENLPLNSLVATITADDVDLLTNPSTEDMTYTLLEEGDWEKFTIVEDELRTNEIFDFETKDSYSITIQADDGGGHPVTAPFTITITNDSLTVSIAKATDGVEKDEPVVGHFILTLEKAHPSNITVSFNISGSANNDIDYWLSSTPDGVDSLTDSIVFPANQTTRDIYVRVNNDDVVEADETVILTLTGTNNADVTVAASPDDTASVTIADDDISSASVEATTPTTVEGGAIGQFTVTLSKVADTATTLSYTLGGTATNTADYATLSGSLVIAANTASATIDVAAVADTLVEGTQTVELTLSENTSNEAITASGSATVSIQDIDTGTISIAGTTDAREPATNGLFTVSLSPISEFDVTVAVSSPASPTDYTALPASVTIPAGSASATLPVYVLNDSYDEYDETLTVSMGAITANGDSQFALGASSGSISIIDDDALPKISINDVTIDPEGASASTRTAHFTVSLDRATEKTVRIDYATSDDTAVAGADYLYASGTHTFDTVTHETSFTIEVTVNGDELVEGDELFDVDLVLMNGDAAVIKKGVGVTTIVDDDYAAASIAATTASTDEGSGTPGQFTVTLTKASQSPVVVTYSVEGSATSASDYSALTDSLTIPANTLTGTIDVASIQDNLVEGDETVIVTLLSTDNSRVTLDPNPENQTAAVNITDNDNAVVSVSATTPTKLEGGGEPAVFTLSLDNPTQSAVTIDYEVTGTATSGTDYSPLDGSVTIPALATSTTVEVSPLDDELVEGDETIIITLTSASDSRVSAASDGTKTATATITDDDTAEISIVTLQNPAAENDGGEPTNGEYAVSLSNPARSDVTVDIAVSGTASAGTDYSTISAKVTIPAGNSSITIPLAVIEDALVEGDETAILTISNPQPAGGLDSGRFSISDAAKIAVITITDDDYATLTVTPSMTPAAEGGANGEFTITASKASQAAVIVEYALAGTATNGIDYSDGEGGLSGTITLPAEATKVTIPVVVVDDSLVEGSETVNLTLTAPDTGRVLVDPGSAGSATVDIDDNDQALISIHKLADTTENGSAASFQISVDKPSQTDLDVSFALSGTADSSGLHQDYSLSSPDGILVGTTLTIPGGSSSVLLTVTPLDDSVVEGSESVNVTLTGPTEGLTVVTPVVGDQSDTMTVADDDSSVLTIASSGSPSEDSATGVFTITASKVSQVDVVIGYSIDGTAANGTDYTSAGSALSGTVTLPAFTSSVEIPVSVVNDLIVEETETIILTLSTPDSGLVQVDPGSGGNASLTIIDNDTATIAIHASANAVEGGAAGHYVVSVSKASQAALEVTFAVGGLAIETDDYSLASTNAQSLTSTTVTLPPGALSVDITVNAVDDNLVEGTEDLILLLTGPKVGTVKVGTPNSAKINITDNDTATVAISAVTAASEDGVPGKFEITASKPLADDLTITFAVSGSADKDGDYQDYSLSSTNLSLTSTTITLAAGDQSTFINVNAVDDAVVESNEEVIISLTQTSDENAILATGGAESGVINLYDNDTSEVSVTSSEATIAESGLSMQFTVTATNASQIPLVVTYTMGGAADNGVDYNQTTPLSGTVTIPAYATQVTFDLIPVQDILVEGSESISLTLSGTDNASVAVASDGSQIANVTLTDDDTAEISITPSVSPAAENGANSPINGEYTVSMTNPASADVTVDVAVSGTAANGTDFAAIASTAVIPAGENSVTIDLLVSEDSLVEGDETAILTISNPAPAGGLSSALFTISGSASSASITITDDDTALASIAMFKDASEPSTDGWFTVNLDKLSARDVTLSYSVNLASTATSGSDYAALSGEVLIPAGQASAVIVVDVQDDSISENDETVSLTLTGTSSERIGLDAAQYTASLTIVSDDPDPVISVSPVTVTEGDSGTTTASFTVSMDRDSQKGVSVDYSTADGTALQPADYTAASGTLNLGDGTLSAAVDVSVIGDLLVEGDETFDLTLSQAVNATLSNEQPSLTVTGTITNDDSSSASVAKTQDAAEPATNGVFTVTLTNPVQVDTTVYYNVIGSAIAGSDYTALSGSVLIPAGSTSQTINVVVLDDAVAEFNETVQVTLSSASDPLTLDLNPTNLTATVYLADNDTDPTLSVNDITVVEGDSGTTLATFTITLSRLSEKGVSVQYRTSNATAVAPSDYQSTTGTLSFGSSELTRTISVPVVGDQVVEVDKYFNLVLETPVYATINKGVGSGTIQDNDTAVVQIYNNANAAEQDQKAGEFTVALSLPVENAVTVTYSVGGTATFGSDYTALSGSITIPANTLTSTITISPIDDSLIEGDETVGVTLTGEDNSRVSIDPLTENQTADVVIVDNDTSQVSVSATTDSTQEGGVTPGTFKVTTTNAAQVPILIYYTVTGSATPNSDYTALTGSVTIPPLETNAIIDVMALDDSLVEPGETVIITLDNTNNVNVSLDPLPANQTATIAIEDNDTALVSVSVNPASIEEGSLTPGIFTFTLSQQSQASVTINYNVGGSASAVDDYAELSGSVVIPEMTSSVSVDVFAIDDSILEGDENLSLTLSGTNNPQITVDPSHSDSLLTLVDNDTSEVSIEKTRDAAEPSTNGQFTVTLTNPVQIDTTIIYTVSGNASADVDYTVLTGSLVIPASQTSGTIEISVSDDAIAEFSETVKIDLSSASGLVTLTTLPDDLTATVNIVDDDPDPVISVSPVTVTEGDSGTTTASFTVSMDRDSQKGVSVDYSTANGTALQPADYTAASGTINLGDGTLSAAVDVSIIGDLLVEGDETFDLTLSQAVNATLSNEQPSLTVTGTITNDDSSSASVAKTQDAAEPATNGVFTVTLTNPVQVDTTITFSVSGTATAASDYTALSGSLTIPALSTTATITVPVIDDLISENAETVVVTLTTVDASGLSGLSISDTNGTASLSITDNETDPRISIENTSGSEAAGTFTFNVTLDRASEKGITVKYMTASSSATDTADFTPTSGTLSFGSSQTSLPITVSIMDDSLIEGDETFTVVLYEQTNATLFKASAFGTIIDNDFATVSVSASAQAAEDAVNGQFSVTLDTAIENDIQVYYTVESASTATSGSDFTMLSGSVNIPAGQVNAPISVVVQDDNLVEGNEAVQITLSGVSSSLARITTIPENRTAQVTITDNDTGKLSITATTATASEPSTNGQFAINLDNPTQYPLQVTYNVAGNATANNDYLALTGTATIPAMSSSVNVDVTVLNNNIPENPETVILTLTGPNNTLFSIDTTNGHDTATVTINDEDPDPLVSVSDVSINEGDTGSQTLTFTISLSDISAKTATVDYTLTDGSATVGEDYAAGSGSLTFNPGETSKTVDVTVYGDLLPEADETINLVLSNPLNLSLTDDTGVATIIDNDTPELSIDNVTLAEGNSGTTAFTFTVTLSPASSETVTVDFATSNGTAEAGLDFGTASGTLTFNPFETTKTITINVMGDTEIENDETFQVTLGNPSANAVLSTTNYQGLGTIQNDEALPVISINTLSQDEGNSGTSTFTFTVTLNVANIVSVTVDYATENGTATVENSDFIANNGTLTFAPGETSKTIVVTANGDRLVESDETFTVRLTNPNNATFTGEGISLATTGTIYNDDHAPALLGNLVISVNEDSALAFTAANFTGIYSDSDSDPMASVTILTLPTHGTLRLNTTNIIISQIIPLDDLGKINYTPEADYFGNDSFSWTASDGVNLAGTPSEVQITVSPVNDPPTLDAIQDVTLIRSTSSYSFHLTGVTGGVDDDTAGLSVTAVSDNQNVLPNLTANFQTPENIWMLTLSPTGTAGIAHVTVTVDDRGSENNTVSRSFTVSIINANLVISPSGTLTTTEGGAFATFNVSLAVKPLANVTVGIASSNTAEGTVSVDALTFTPENWNTPQQVTLTGVDDAVLDGNISYQVTLDTSSSLDSEYALLSPVILQAINVDNESFTGWSVFLPFVVLQ